MTRCRSCVAAFLIICLLLIVGVPNAFAGDLTVSAALSLKDAFSELGRQYETRHAGTKVVLNFGASGDLLRQIEGGAPVAVFAPASQKDMDEGIKMGVIDQATRRDFTANTLVLIVPSNGTLSIRSFSDLASAAVRKVAIGNPKTVPAGRYASEVLSYYKLDDAVKDKLVYAENVRQALDYASRGEVNAAVVYMTDAMTRPVDVRVVAEAPAESHGPIVYPIAAVKGSKSAQAGAGFIEFVMSREGQAVLKKFGFRPIK